MKNGLLKKLLFAFVITTLLSLGSCKEKEVREGEMVTPYDSEARATDTTAIDTTSRMKEDSLIEAPSP